jgi:hypothetical protein
MPFLRRSPRVQIATPTTTHKRGFLSRLIDPAGTRSRRTEKITITPKPIIGRKRRSPMFARRRRAPVIETNARLKPAIVVHHKRKPSLGDKIHGLGKKIKGSLTGRPGKKAAGTRMMRGTDGRGSHRRTIF